jgi:hypothetical protein
MQSSVCLFRPEAWCSSCSFRPLSFRTARAAAHRVRGSGVLVPAAACSALCVRRGVPPLASRRTRLDVSRCGRRSSPGASLATSRRRRRGRPGTTSSTRCTSPDGRGTQTCLCAPRSGGRLSFFRFRFSFVYFAKSQTGVFKRRCSRGTATPRVVLFRRERRIFHATKSPISRRISRECLSGGSGASRPTFDPLCNPVSNRRLGRAFNLNRRGWCSSSATGVARSTGDDDVLDGAGDSTSASRDSVVTGQVGGSTAVLAEGTLGNGLVAESQPRVT